MNMPILAPEARADESDVGQTSRRKPPSPRPESWRAKLLATALAALLLASAMLLWPRMGETANAGRDGVLLYPTGDPARPAAAHARGTAHRDAPGVGGGITHHGPLLAGKHVAHRTKGAG